ncbi:hypothetical protein, partial [Staphylococcus haemolyticus]|uniref:hypothetical protein n=1 Tax=Staphylococcus haemolyticus TaxID=1283 RepID=UPI0030C431EB
MSVKIIKVYRERKKLARRIGSEHNKFVAGLNKTVEIMGALLGIICLALGYFQFDNQYCQANSAPFYHTK